MSDWFRSDDKARARLAGETEAGLPIPTRIMSNGEYSPLPQTVAQRRVEASLLDIAEHWASKLSMDRRSFLKSSFGLAAAFTALNSVFGPSYAVAQDEMADAGAAADWAARHADQFIFDGHLHFVHEDYDWPGILGFRNAARMMQADGIPQRDPGFEDVKFLNFVKEVYFDSDTSVGIISTATSDDPARRFLSNEQIARDVERLNTAAGSRRLMGHAAFHPGAENWWEALEEAIEIHRPISWKGYTVGDPLSPTSVAPWRLDDEDLVYPAFERMVEAGITNVCIHKGLMPADYTTRMPDLWPYATVNDVGKAAQDWPQLNFIIYHAALRPVVMFDPGFVQNFEDTGRMEWASELADIPAQYGVSNVYADVGTSFGQGAITQPRLAAALMSILVRGLGADHVLWGTDAVWWGAPQWQIEAFRRIEVPDDLQERFGLPPLGPSDGDTKRRIFGLNSADIYGFSDAERTVAHYARDRLSQHKAEYRREGADPSNAYYGFITDED
ncbi:amidohydrolase family protein [Hyphobacterium sp. HN65]|uniref:Amidohydrolase family protein n=1 Tax=Hyphobacterium lacteum TaxID=3116575 RepID=A0ABU7LNA7_9PROT|nr:amidohydrolase family protein [Hyphobacterium sp. HN65]MEE2525394.1 amidohydrolase family protein [Hyphobacterium sp. HN65]